MMNHPSLRQLALLLGLTCTGAVPLWAAGSSPAGSLDFDSIGLPPAATVDISMGRVELVALATASAGDENTAGLLAGLEAVYLRQYALPDTQTVNAAEALPARLVADGWVLSRHEVQGDKHVYIHAKMDDDEFVGFTVLVIDAASLVAIANVVGDIPPAQLGQLGLPLHP